MAGVWAPVLIRAVTDTSNLVAPSSRGETEIGSSDYKEDEDPSTFVSKKTGRGPLKGDWMKTCKPVMCAYKLVTVEFKWFGLQNRVEAFIQKTERRIFLNFHRQVFCWMDRWHGMTMADIRKLEEQTKKELDEQRKKGTVRGTKGEE
ncbi:hypothetical protein HPB52_014288 [Rhipicephalus sanguineus]|uniref:Phosphatidylinositol transfer protein N-terminal domain-containing protein n=1 Tax=Rhipicephalus sanguineus TaxID=34632 RepID=A0A9D4PWH4_RHISA|nr:hypothetical protein HPB52_014288 [Rhipicephalus sanguineus]